MRRKGKHPAVSRPSGRVRTMSIMLPLFLLLGIGMVMIYDASVAEATQIFHDKYYFVRLHTIWVLVGLATTWIVSRLHTSWLQRASPYLFGASMVLLILVLVPGIGAVVQGARRWIRIGPLLFQPAEVVKLTSVLYFSVWLTAKRQIKPFLTLSGALLLLLVLQPDLGTALIIVGTAFFMLFVSGIPIRSIAVAMLIGVVSILGLIVASPYRAARLTTFLDPTRDTLGRGYHINQILLSLGSGRWFGLGLGRSRQKFEYLPEATTDSIFAIVGEELGFVGATFLLVLYGIFYFQLFRVAIRETDPQRKLLAAGLTGWLVIQMAINLAGMVALLPLTGVPLPFISYGRSSLISQLVAVGILTRISLTQK